jgi:hypothetical protein
MRKTIGFFGDSFCSVLEPTKDFKFDDITYIKKLVDYYDLELVHKGSHGSSIWDTLLIQMDPYIKNDDFPDICVFCWSSPGRLFHRRIREINSGTAFQEDPDEDKDVWNAAKMYFEHFYDPDKDKLEHLSCLQYIDNNIFSKLSSDIKVINVWSFGEISNWQELNINDVTYSYRWKHGVEIRPSFISLSLHDQPTNIRKLVLDHRPNHLDGEKNDQAFRWIKKAIESEDGTLLNFKNEIWKA